jgi:hypothetical protein
MRNEHERQRRTRVRKYECTRVRRWSQNTVERTTDHGRGRGRRNWLEYEKRTKVPPYCGMRNGECGITTTDHRTTGPRTTDHGLRTTHHRPQTSAESIKMWNARSYWERRAESPPGRSPYAAEPVSREVDQQRTSIRRYECTSSISECGWRTGSREASGGGTRKGAF